MNIKLHDFTFIWNNYVWIDVYFRYMLCFTWIQSFSYLLRKKKVRKVNLKWFDGQVKLLRASLDMYMLVCKFTFWVLFMSFIYGLLVEYFRPYWCGFLMFWLWIHWFWFVVLSLVVLWTQKGGEAVNCSSVDSNLTEAEGCIEGGI